MGYSFILETKILYTHHPIDKMIHITFFVIPVVEHWLEREIVQWVNHEGSITQPIAAWTDPLQRSYISLPITFVPKEKIKLLAMKIDFVEGNLVLPTNDKVYYLTDTSVFSTSIDTH